MTDRPDMDAIEALLTRRSHVYRLTGPMSGVERIEVAFDDEPPAVFVRSDDAAVLPPNLRAADADPSVPLIRSLLTYARGLERRVQNLKADYAPIDFERANYRTEINLWKRTVQEQNAKIAALEQERDEARRDAETAAAAENANAADLKAARDLLVEQQRAFVVAVEAMEARHDAEIAGIVEGLRERADALVQDDRFDAASALNDLADSIATTHAAALARHAGRNTGGSNG